MRRALTVAALVLTAAAPALAVDYPQEAFRMVLKQDILSGKEKLVWLSKVPAIVLPAADPISVGGSLRVQGQYDVTVPFPAGAANWKTNAAGTLFKFVNNDAPSGPSPCKAAVIKQGAVLKIVCKDSIIDLIGPTQSQVTMTLTVGGDSYCSTCVGPFEVRVDEPGKFIAKGCEAPSFCAPGTTTTTTPSTTSTSATMSSTTSSTTTTTLP